MAFLRRPGRPSLPDDVRRMLQLGKGVRVLAWSPLVGGGWVVATVAGLRALLPTGVLVDRPWTDVDHVTWDRDAAVLAVWWVGSRQPTTLDVGTESFLPEVVHERMRASLVLTREVGLPGGRTVRVVLRKAADGTLSTQVVPGRGVRLADPQVAALVARAEAEIRAEAGADDGAGGGRGGGGGRGDGSAADAGPPPELW
ncbi:MAG TPA: hypothetical protein VI248_03320 [Kineosporiaceae bacterium]